MFPSGGRVRSSFFVSYFFFSFFFPKDFIYLFMRETHRERERDRQREKQAPCKEPYVGLDPRTPGSHPGPKAGTKPLSHPGCPMPYFKGTIYERPGIYIYDR